MYVNLGSYTYTDCSWARNRVVSNSYWSGPGDSVKNYDQMLHQSLVNIFLKDCPSTSKRIKKCLRGPQLKSEIKSILDQEPVLSKQFSQKDLGKLSLLWIAVLGCYQQSAELLVRSGADVNEPFGSLDTQMIDEKWTVLYVLLQMDPSPENERLIRLIVDYGADLHVRDKKGNTLLHYGVLRERVQITEMLLEKGVNVNAADDNGETPLLIAVNGDNIKTLPKELVALLMKHGAGMHARDSMKRTVLHYAVKKAQVQMTKMFLEKGADVNAADNVGMTPLLEALRVRGPRAETLVALLMEHGADIQARDYRGRTVVQYAVRGGRIQMTEMFINKGVDVNTTDNITGMTPLLEAVAKGASTARGFIANEMVMLLVGYGADVLVKDREGMNALHCLINIPEEKAVDLGRFLIKMGVPLDDSNNHDEQPIHRAVAYGRDELVKLFLDHGANVNAPTGLGESQLEIACRYERRVRRSEDYDWSKVIRLLVSAGADVLEQAYDGNTPLALITYTGYKNRVGQESMPLIEALALKKALQPSIKLKDEEIIERYQKLQDYYQKCSEEIDRMKSTRLTENCTVFQLATKSQRQLAVLMRNPDFEIQFSLYDLNHFSLYAIHLRAAFERAKRYYYTQLKQEDVINKAVYYILPDLVVEKVVHYVLNCCKHMK